jgi:hypothetical protein
MFSCLKRGHSSFLFRIAKNGGGLYNVYKWGSPEQTGNRTNQDKEYKNGGVRFQNFPPPIHNIIRRHLHAGISDTGYPGFYEKTIAFRDI